MLCAAAARDLSPQGDRTCEHCRHGSAPGGTRESAADRLTAWHPASRAAAPPKKDPRPEQRPEPLQPHLGAEQSKMLQTHRSWQAPSRRVLVVVPTNTLCKQAFTEISQPNSVHRFRTAAFRPTGAERNSNPHPERRGHSTELLRTPGRAGRVKGVARRGEHVLPQQSVRVVQQWRPECPNACADTIELSIGYSASALLTTLAEDRRLSMCS